jgi:two-component system chemotaxis response regulator CheB
VAQRDTIVIGASAGGIRALRTIAAGLPADFPASLLVVVHVRPDVPNMLPEVLARSGPLPVEHPRHGSSIRPGQIYVAPPNRHLLITPERQIHLGNGPKENGARPAIDPLFRSAALCCGSQTAGVILSGALDDGVAGLCAIKQAGGIAIVQDPYEAEASSMPASALRHVAVDYCATSSQIPQLLTRMVTSDVPLRPPRERSNEMPKETEISVDVAADETHRENAIRELGTPSLFTCPECHGSLLEIKGPGPVRFRCHTGHAFTIATLEAELRAKIESSSWNTIRSLEEHAMILEEMIKVYGNELDRGELTAKIKNSRHRAQLVRQALVEHKASTTA